MSERDKEKRAPGLEIDDIDYETDEELGDAAAALAKLKKLRQQLKEAQDKRNEYLTGWQREKADAINGRKEAMVETERRAKREKMMLIEDLLPALDSFDMAAGNEAWAGVNDGFRTGIENVRNQLLDVLSRHDVERYGKIGEQFDPRLHEAVQEMSDVAGESHSIVRILRYGYKNGDQVLRAAQVVIKS